MNSLIVYYSKFGNTQSVADAIGKALEQGGDARVVHLEQMAGEDLTDVNLVIMGSPTHKMNLPENIRPLLDELPKKMLKGKLIAAFDTSYKMSGWLIRFTAGKKLDRRLRRLGGKRIIPPEIFLVTGREGPLYKGELERAQEWAALILERSQSKSN